MLTLIYFEFMLVCISERPRVILYGWGEKTVLILEVWGDEEKSINIEGQNEFNHLHPMV